MKIARQLHARTRGLYVFLVDARDRLSGLRKRFNPKNRSFFSFIEQRLRKKDKGDEEERRSTSSSESRWTLRSSSITISRMTKSSSSSSSQLSLLIRVVNICYLFVPFCNRGKCAALIWKIWVVFIWTSILHYFKQSIFFTKIGAKPANCWPFETLTVSNKCSSKLRSGAVYGWRLQYIRE